MICGFDRRTTLSGTPRDMCQIAQELDSHGVEVRLMSGVSVTDEYREVNRVVNGTGIQHAKGVLIDDVLIVGSCNWTTSSRSNYELGVLVRLRSEVVPIVTATFMERLALGQRLDQDAGVAVRKPYQGSQRSASHSQARGRRSYSLDPSQAVD